jgi:hypothetical protein
MKKLKVLLLSVLVLGAVVMIFSLLIPANSRVSRTVSVKSQRDSIMKSLLNLENWSQWHPQLKSDSARRLIQYGAVRSGPNASLSYNKFTMTLTGVTDSSLKISMVNPAGEQLPTQIDVFNLGDSCAVNWFASFHAKWYPWEKFRNIFYDNIHGPSLEANLKGLKAFLERK